MATAAAPALKLSNLLEYVDNRGVALKVDREKGVIHRVKLLGSNSANGNVYQPTAIEQAVGLYEGSPIYINHDAANPAGPRRYEDRFGIVRNAVAEGGCVYGDVHYNPKHSLAEAVLWDAENATEKVGFSHNIQAKHRREGTGRVIETVLRVMSVDLVSCPATTTTIAEQTNEGQSMTIQEITIDQLKADRKDLVAQLIAEQESTDELATLKTENAALKAKLDEHETAKKMADKKALVEQKIKEAKIPDVAVTEVFREQCLGAKDEATLTTIIEDRRGLVALHGGRPLSREQGASDKFAEPAAAQGLAQGKAYADEQIARLAALKK